MFIKVFQATFLDIPEKDDYKCTNDDRLQLTVGSYRDWSIMITHTEQTHISGEYYYETFKPPLSSRISMSSFHCSRQPKGAVSVRSNRTKSVSGFIPRQHLASLLSPVSTVWNNALYDITHIFTGPLRCVTRSFSSFSGVFFPNDEMSICRRNKSTDDELILQKRAAPDSRKLYLHSNRHRVTTAETIRRSVKIRLISILHQGK